MTDRKRDKVTDEELDRIFDDAGLNEGGSTDREYLETMTKDMSTFQKSDERDQSTTSLTFMREREHDTTYIQATEPEEKKVKKNQE